MAGSYRIVVGPEILVDPDPNRPQTEMQIAANPRDVNNLVAVSMAWRSDKVSQVLFASHDGGNTWTSFEPPHFQLAGGADPLITFGPTGTAHFLPGDLYRSRDGGSWWELTQSRAASGDHPWAAADLTSGPYRGNVYWAAGGRVFRSTNDGRSITDTFALPPGLVMNGGVAVLSDGAVLVGLSPDEGARGEGGRGLATVLSTDGGRTWSAPAAVTIPPINRDPSPSADPSRGFRSADRMPIFGVAFAADTSARSPYRDRIYVVWTDVAADSSRIALISSSDRGRTWSGSTRVAPGGGVQFLPTAATNGQGVLGVLFGDTHGFRATDGRFHFYFTASVDGGANFLPPRRLTSAPSVVESESSLRPVLNHAIPYPDSLSVWMFAIRTKHPVGGDYLGLAADVAGTFHPLWADSRSGVFQAYTSRVAVVAAPALGALGAGLSDQVPFSGHITLVIDPIGFDAASGVAMLPIRVRNVSRDTLWGPILVRVKRIGYRGTQPDASDAWKVLNAANGMTGVGSLFAYDEALGDLRMLPPGGVSSPVVWRARFPALRGRHLRLQFDVTARRRSAGPP